MSVKTRLDRIANRAAASADRIILVIFEDPTDRNLFHTNPDGDGDEPDRMYTRKMVDALPNNYFIITVGYDHAQP